MASSSTSQPCHNLNQTSFKGNYNLVYMLQTFTQVYPFSSPLLVYHSCKNMSQAKRLRVVDHAVITGIEISTVYWCRDSNSVSAENRLLTDTQSPKWTIKLQEELWFAKWRLLLWMRKMSKIIKIHTHNRNRLTIKFLLIRSRKPHLKFSKCRPRTLHLQKNHHCREKVHSHFTIEF